MAAPYATTTGPTSRTMWAGRILSGSAIALLALDAAMKLAVPAMMITYSPPLGLAPDPALYRTLGAVLLASLALHLWSRARLLGALLVTAYLGGAVAINLRADMPLFGHTLFGVYIGTLFWLGYWLRDVRLRALLS